VHRQEEVGAIADCRVSCFLQIRETSGCDFSPRSSRRKPTSQSEVAPTGARPGLRGWRQSCILPPGPSCSRGSSKDPGDLHPAQGLPCRAVCPSCSGRRRWLVGGVPWSASPLRPGTSPRTPTRTPGLAERLGRGGIQRSLRRVVSPHILSRHGARVMPKRNGLTSQDTAPRMRWRGPSWQGVCDQAAVDPAASKITPGI